MKPTLIEEDGQWFLETDRDGKTPVEDYGIQVGSGCAVLFYLRFKEHKLWGEDGDSEAQRENDFRKYFIERDVAADNMRGYSNGSLMEIGTKMIAMKDLKPWSGNKVAFLPKSGVYGKKAKVVGTVIQ